MSIMQTFTLSPLSFKVLIGNKLKLTKCEKEISWHIIIPESVNVIEEFI